MESEEGEGTEEGASPEEGANSGEHVDVDSQAEKVNCIVHLCSCVCVWLTTFLFQKCLYPVDRFKICG